jgi:hypothetical protein
MKPVSAFEYGQIESLTGTENNLLDQLRGPHGEKMFEVGWRETRATSFVGVVQLPQTALQILPKMYRRILDGRDGPPGRPSKDDDAARPDSRSEAETPLSCAAIAPYLSGSMCSKAAGSSPPKPVAPTAGDVTDSMSPTTSSPRTTSPTGSSRPPSIPSPAGRTGTTPACVAEATSARRRLAGT